MDRLGSFFPRVEGVVARLSFTVMSPWFRGKGSLRWTRNEEVQQRVGKKSAWGRKRGRPVLHSRTVPGLFPEQSPMLCSGVLPIARRPGKDKLDQQKGLYEEFSSRRFAVSVVDGLRQLPGRSIR